MRVRVVSVIVGRINMRAQHKQQDARERGRSRQFQIALLANHDGHSGHSRGGKHHQGRNHWKPISVEYIERNHRGRVDDNGQ